ncbi:MAG: HNH endonuclease [Bacteroidetes bacterium]|nr:HNH endonuclease [Bacteroidota bacterium]
MCKFNFAVKYPVIGEKFIECHHKLFLATGGERITSEKELALVCSNCHRMLHKRKPDKSYYTIEGLKQLIKNV